MTTPNVTVVDHVMYSVRVNVTDPDGTVHKVGTSHRERRWWCYYPCGNPTCPHIPSARQIAQEALPPLTIPTETHRVGVTPP